MLVRKRHKSPLLRYTLFACLFARPRLFVLQEDAARATEVCLHHLTLHERFHQPDVRENKASLGHSFTETRWLVLTMQASYDSFLFVTLAPVQDGSAEAVPSAFPFNVTASLPRMR